MPLYLSALLNSRLALGAGVNDGAMIHLQGAELAALFPRRPASPSAAAAVTQLAISVCLLEENQSIIPKHI